MVAGEEKGRVVAGKLLESSGAVSITFDAILLTMTPLS
jgi:hypothetical protein